ncbi:MAG: BTAD domain-containing putative transcriptional regulator [Thermoflexales bacterium]
MLRIAALGPLELTLDDISLARLPAKAKALLVYLAIEARPHSRQRLAGLLWGESTEAQARTSLRNTLMQLREAGVGPHLVIGRQQVAFDVSQPHRLDVAELLNSAAQVGSRGAGIYIGEFLADSPLRDAPQYEEWVLERREQCRLRAMALLRDAAEQMRAMGQMAEAITAARRLIALDPLREASHRLAIGLYAANRQRAEALRQYEDCRRVLAEALGIEPSAELHATAERIRAAELGASAPARPAISASLPAPTTTFIGRAREIANVVERLGDSTRRLVTLTGMGGIGKTRLAIEAARVWESRFTQATAPAIFVEVAGLGDVDSVARALAAALALPPDPLRPPAALAAAALAERTALVVFDSCEHLAGVFPSIADLISGLLEAAPHVRMLATSREPLNLADEIVLEVGEMEEALALFSERAQRANLRFSVDDERAAVARICALVQGVPLAIELAAAWTRTLACADIAAALTLNLDLLQPAHGIPDRQAGVRAAFEHSWQLLPPEEQQGLASLSIFRGGFTGPAARAVAQLGLRGLNMLAHRSLVRRSTDGRYDLHPLIRAFAAEHVAETGGLASRLAVFYAGQLAMYRDAIRIGDAPTLSMLAPDAENILVAWRASLEQCHAVNLSAMLDGLLWLTEYRGWFRASERLFADALAALPDDDAGRLLRARLFTARGHCLLRLGRREDAHAAHSEAVNTLDNAPDSPGLSEHRAFALLLMGTALTDPPGQMRLFARSLALYESNGDAWGIGAALNNLGECAELLGDMPAAQRYHRASLAHCLGIGDQPGVAFARANLGGLLRLEGRLDEAEAELRAGLEVANALGFDYARGLLTQNLAACAWARRDAPTARRLAEDAQRIFERSQSADRAGLPARLLAEIDAAETLV